ncbi:hypothetical protein [Streptomyces lasiicapitis]|uniref:hypothetical protein n=1 Tax=Streptomyces lasiicapitis TaxID=1923961 RepID=UPI0036799776
MKRAETKAAPPPPSTKSAQTPHDLSHTWVVTAEIQVEQRIADFRGSFKATTGQRVDAMEVYCKGCRRPHNEVKALVTTETAITLSGQ